MKKTARKMDFIILLLFVSVASCAAITKGTGMLKIYSILNQIIRLK